MMHRSTLGSTLALFALLALAACGGRRPPATGAEPAGVAATERATLEQVDVLWQHAESAYRRGKWSEAQTLLERFLLETGPGDGRVIRARFYVAECQLAQGNRLEAARDFRKVSDDTPGDPLAPDALLRVGDAYAELWRRPELDPTYGQTALATYQELGSRYPNTDAARRAQLKIAELQNRFAYKEYKAALYYYRLKAYDSAILYLKDLVASYPRAEIAPQALVKLVQAYGVLGYKEDAQETCGYLRRFHPGAQRETDRVCPAPPAAAVAAPAPSGGS